LRYQSGGAFRRALETRLRDQSLVTGLPLVRLRKMVAFDRLLARLVQAQPDQWILKGGLALQLRLGNRARTTKDMDLLSLVKSNKVLDSLREAAALDLGDWFIFEVGRPSIEQERKAGGIRHTVRSLVDGRTFERFHVDVGVGDPLIEAVEQIAMPAILSFAEIDPVVVPCYPISQQLAEKCHAYIRPYASGASSRIKDFVDMILLAEMDAISGQKLTAAIEATFREAGIHDIPNEIPRPPQTWESGFRRMADEVGLSGYSLGSSYTRIQQFLDPILSGKARDLQWNPDRWSWN
jgi:hypothetical protein